MLVPTIVFLTYRNKYWHIFFPLFYEENGLEMEWEEGAAAMQIKAKKEENWMEISGLKIIRQSKQK